jgi:hypothetical protein
MVELNNLQFTVAQALQFLVFTSRLLATDLNIETIIWNHYAVFLLFRLQSLVLLSPNLHSTNLHNSLTAPNCTALVPIRFSTANFPTSDRWRLVPALNCTLLQPTTDYKRPLLYPISLRRVLTENTLRHSYTANSLVRWLSPSNEIQTFVLLLLARIAGCLSSRCMAMIMYFWLALKL